MSGQAKLSSAVLTWSEMASPAECPASGTMCSWAAGQACAVGNGLRDSGVQLGADYRLRVVAAWFGEISHSDPKSVDVPRLAFGGVVDRIREVVPATRHHGVRRRGQDAADAGPAQPVHRYVRLDIRPVVSPPN
jgi:hypothetical protein